MEITYELEPLPLRNLAKDLVDPAHSIHIDRGVDIPTLGSLIRYCILNNELVLSLNADQVANGLLPEYFDRDFLSRGAAGSLASAPVSGANDMPVSSGCQQLWLVGIRLRDG